MKPKTCKTIALCNQIRGGVTKTTTTANLGIGLAMQGKKVLLVDIDPQENTYILDSQGCCYKLPDRA